MIKDKEKRNYKKYIWIGIISIFLIAIFSITYNKKNALGTFKKIGRIENSMGISDKYIRLNNGDILAFFQDGKWSLAKSKLFYNIYYIGQNNVVKKKTVIYADTLKPIIAYNNRVYLLYTMNSETPTKSKTQVLEYNYRDDILSNKQITTLPYTSLVDSISLPNNIAIIFNRYPQNKVGNKVEYTISSFNPQNLESKTLYKYEKDKQYAIQITPPMSSLDIENLNLITHNNRLYIAITKITDYGKIKITLYDIDKNKLIDINTKQIELHKNDAGGNLKWKIIWFKNGNFLLITYPDFGKKTFFDAYLLNNMTAIKQNELILSNNNLFKSNVVSPNNYFVLNDSQVLFIGGQNGTGEFSWFNKTCFLYEMNKNRIIKLNNFKYNIANQNITLFQNHILLFGGVFQNSKFAEPEPFKDIYIYSYKQLNLVQEKQK